MQQTMHDIMYTGHYLQQTSQNMYIKLHVQLTVLVELAPAYIHTTQIIHYYVYGD